MNENEPARSTPSFGFPGSEHSAPAPAGRGPSGGPGGLRGLLNNKWAFLVIGLLLGGAAGAGVAESTKEDRSSRGSAASRVAATERSQEPSPEPEPTVPAPEPSPDGTFGSSCDYILGDQTESSTGYRFVAGADVENTGNVGIVVEVEATFKQLGSQPIVLKETAKIPFGESDSIQMTKQVTSNEIDLIQAAQDSGEICSVDVSIADSFGEPQEA